MADPEVVMPIDVRQADDRTLAIRWQDEHESKYGAAYLRNLCRCAACVDEWTGAKRLDSGSVPEDVHPLRVQSVGRYGMKIDWSDGHNTGIYTFTYLREICPCPKCQSPKGESSHV